MMIPTTLLFIDGTTSSAEITSHWRSAVSIRDDFKFISVLVTQ